jgi:AcrR family transcriptional regulator
MQDRQPQSRDTATPTQPSASSSQPPASPSPQRTAFEPPRWDTTELRILDAAAALIPMHGIDGLTLTGIAKQAGVSRPTVYRRWPGTDEVVRAALLRTTIGLIEQLGSAPSDRAEIVESIVRFSRLFRTDPIFGTLLRRQPEVFTRYSLQRIGSSQRLILRWLAESVASGQQAGSVRPGDEQQIAVMLLLISQSAILSHHTVSSLIGDAELDAQLGAAIDGYLRP